MMMLLVGACGPQPEGNWSVTGTCPPESKLGQRIVTATAAMTEVAPDTFRGTIINSFGQKGRVEAVLTGNAMTAKTDWAGSGSTEALLAFDSRTRSFAGTDTEGCAVEVRRPG